MQGEEIFENIAEEAVKINRRWADDAMPSKAVTAEVEYAFFQNGNADIISKAAYYYALKERVRVRYGNIFKKLFRFFQFKNETALLVAVKKLLNFGDSSVFKSADLRCGGDAADPCGGSDQCDGSGSVDEKSGTDLQKKANAKPHTEGEKQHETVKNFAKKPYADLADEIKQEILAERKDTVDKKAGKETAVRMGRNNAAATSADSAQDNKNLTADGIGNASSAKQNAGVKERIEIPKEDLLSGGSRQKPDKKAVDEIKPVKTGVKSVAETPAKTVGEKIVNDFNYADTLIRKPVFTERLADNAAVDINFDTKKAINPKPQENVAVYYDKRPKSVIANEPAAYERQKGELAGEEIAKMSNEDIQAIKEVLQEELNKQMDAAERNGEVYKMPVGIKEALNHSIDEKSEAQANKVDDVIPNIK